MDYVKETLERQNAVWTALFVGSEEIEQWEQDVPGRESWIRQDNQGVWKQAAEQEETLHAGEKTAAEWSPLTDEFLTNNEGLRELERVLNREEARLLREAARQRRMERAEQISAQEKEAAERKTALLEEAARWERENSKELTLGAVGVTDAQEISRRFERDARRYDGGFIFY